MYVVVLGIGTGIGVWTSRSCPAEPVHNTSHESRHCCWPALASSAHIALHASTHRLNGSVGEGTGTGVLVSISCVPPAAHTAEHESRQGCKSEAAGAESSHIAMHNDTHGPGAALVVGTPVVVAGIVLGTGPGVVL